MGKISIKKFVEEYSNRTIETLKEQYIKDNLEIIPYVPIAKKISYAQLIVNRTIFKQESYTDVDGEIKYKPTSEIEVNSVAQYIQFCRAVIELYTNLEISNNFTEDYDNLKSSGLLDLLMTQTDKRHSLIPFSELGEFRMILDMKEKDITFNETTTQAFISKQLNKITYSLEPFVNASIEKLDTLNESDFRNFINIVKNNGVFANVDIDTEEKTR